MIRVLFVAALLVVGVVFATISDDSVLEKADRAYAAHNYKSALGGYRSVLKLPEHEAAYDRVRRRIGSCLAKLARFGEARAALADAVARAATDRDRARAQVERGVLAFTMPGYYYEKDGVKQWGRWVQGATYHHVGSDLHRQGVEDLESARTFYAAAAEDAGGFSKQEKAAFAREHFRSMLELASGLEQVRAAGGKDPVDVGAGAAGYDALASLNERMAWAYDAAMTLQASVGDRESRVLAGYLKAMAFRRVMEGYRSYEFDAGSIRCKAWGRESTSFVLPDAWNPLKILQDLLTDARHGSLSDDVTFALATIQRRLGLFVDSVATCKRLIDAHPKSRFVPDCREAIEQMTFPRLRLETGRSVAVGSTATARLVTRNVKNVRVRIFRFPLEKLLDDDRLIKNPEVVVSHTQSLVDGLSGDLYAGGEVASLSLKTRDAGRHLSLEDTVSLPVRDEGAYLVEAVSGELVYRDLLVVTRLGLIRQVDGERTLVYAMDTTTGAPMKNVDVLVRHRYRVNGLFGQRWVVRPFRGKTDDDGLFEVQHPSPDSSTGRYVGSFAIVNGQFALVDPSYYRTRRAAKARQKAYVFTDRPVYRPGHEVNFSALLRKLSDGQYENMPGERVSVQIRDPRGTTIFDQALKSDATGSLDASLVLGDEPSLGRYRILLRRGKASLGAGEFRVEEYKKPEFAVIVSGPRDQVRLGGACSATIEGRYYFGAPVAGGGVAYRVFRERYRPSFRRAEPYRELYGSIPGNVDPSDRGSRRELVLRGNGVLGADGRLAIEWDTKAFADGYPEQDSRFVVQADVTDASRRTISGAGTVSVTRTSFLVQVSSQRAFWSQGEACTFEIQAQTPSGRPLATSGKARVYRITEEERDGGRRDVMEQILEEDASTDERGMGRFRWVADAPGRFAISYQAKDDWDGLVRGDVPVWVHGDGFSARDFQMKNLEIISDKRVYEPGETALVMVNSNYRDSAVLLCLEADDRTLHREVVRLNGKTAVLSLPIAEAYVPNVYLTAYTVREGGFFSVTHELLVPPTKQLLDVSLQFDKPQYRPGERGQATIVVKDDDGAPVAARVALSCLDASIFYIEQDRTPDIRRYFYGARRRRGTGRSGSLSQTFQGYLARDVGWGRFETSGWLPAWGHLPGRVTKILEGGAFGRRDLSGGVPRSGLEQGDELTEEPSVSDSESAWGDEAMARERRRGNLGAETGRASRVDFDRSVAPLSSAAVSGNADPFAVRGKKRSEQADRESRDMRDLVEVRSDFRDLAMWAPEVICDDRGVGTITIPFPQSLTTWRAKAIAWTGDTRVGTSAAETITTKDVLVRLQAPRFFTEGDRVVVSAIVNNRTEESLEAKVSITLGGGALRLAGGAERVTQIEASGEARIDWWCDVIGSGAVDVTVDALTRNDSDAMRMTFPVQRWGALRTETEAAVLDADAEIALNLDVPVRRQSAESELVVTLQPSLALTLLDALPYLIDYPYGCTEQTMSRFIPAVACARTLREAGTSLSQIRKARQSLEEADRRGAFAEVLSDAMLEDVVKAGLQRISGMQNPDGGWGWWKRDRSSPYLTAYVISGLLIAREADHGVSRKMLDEGVAFLAKNAGKIEQLQTGAYVAYALAKAGKPDAKLMERVFLARDDLGIFGNALLASAYAASGDAARSRTIVSNFENTVTEDAGSGTVHWDADGPGWRWWSSPIEANAAVLNALLDVAPEHRWTGPLVKWLVRNRQGGRWTHTRDTALAILALVRYARQAGELDPDYTVDVDCGGQQRTFHVSRENMFAFDNRFVLRGDAVTSGTLPLTIKKRGRGRLYLTSALTCFTQEDRIAKAGHELFVTRSYHKVTEKVTTTDSKGRPVARLTDVLTRIDEGARVRAGDIIEVQLHIESKNDYEYLLFEDMKPAGFEPLKLRSGGSYARGICSNVEFRDERTAFFVTWLQQGKHTLTYRMRAEVPGTLRAPPARGEAMYAPSFKGISDSFLVTVEEMSPVR